VLGRFSVVYDLLNELALDTRNWPLPEYRRSDWLRSNWAACRPRMCCSMMVVTPPLAG